MKKKLLLMLGLTVLLSGCSMKLKNGDDVLVSYEGNGTISTDALYQKMKASYGASAITDLIDSTLLNDLYSETTEEKNYIKENVQAAKSAAESMNVTLSLYLQYYYGVGSEDELKDKLRLDYRRDQYATRYAKENVNDTQINEYYDTQVIGDIEASQILVAVDTSKAEDDDAKEEAKTKAKEKAMDIINKLKKGEDFATLAKENSDDSLTASKGGSLGKVNKDSVSEEIINALISLKDGEYTKEPIESTTGYYILFRTSQDEKKELDNTLKAKITETIAKETVDNTQGYKFTAMKALREKNKVSINDSELNAAYDELNANY